MNTNEYLAKVYMSTPKDENGKCQWSLMAERIEKENPAILNGVSAPRKWLRHKFETKEMQSLIAAAPVVRPTAQDGDTKVIAEDTNKDGSRAKTVELFTSKEMSDMTDTDIVRVLGYDPEMFKLVSSSRRMGTWEAQSPDGVTELHSYKISGVVKPLEPDEVTEEHVANVFLDILRKNREKIPRRTKQIAEGDKIAIVSIADLHLGKLAWAPECGESYDHKIAMARFNQIIDESIARLRNEKGLERIIFFWSQDFFHYDEIDVTTTAGTKQDTDVRWEKMFDYGTELLVDAIERLERLAPVETFYVRSNHDTKTAYYAKELLRAYFHSDDNVHVDRSPAPRKYIRYGVNLFGFGHGDKEGKRIFSMMPIERPEDWGATANHEYFLGHFHSLRTFEESGVIARYLSSPTGPDAWHTESGFIGAQKGAQLFIRGKETGIIAEYFIPVQ